MIFMLISLFFQLTGSGQQPDTDLRSLRWGMSKKEVQTLEQSATFRISDTTLLYRQRWFYNFPASVKFAFVKDQLAGALYIFTDRPVRAQQHWEDYGALVKLLSERYGPPSGEYQNWTVPLYKERPDHYGDAVLLGHLNRSNVWETARTVVTLIEERLARAGRPVAAGTSLDPAARAWREALGPGGAVLAVAIGRESRVAPAAVTAARPAGVPAAVLGDSATNPLARSPLARVVPADTRDGSPTLVAMVAVAQALAGALAPSRTRPDLAAVSA